MPSNLIVFAHTKTLIEARKILYSHELLTTGTEHCPTPSQTQPSIPDHLLDCGNGWTPHVYTESWLNRLPTQVVVRD